MSRCKYCNQVHPEADIANPDYCIARLMDQNEELEAEVAHLRAELAVFDRYIGFLAAHGMMGWKNVDGHTTYTLVRDGDGKALEGK
jgi:hypothetical protein